MASSSSRPPWIVLSRIAFLDPPSGLDVALSVAAPAQVSTITISRRFLPEPITYRDGENPSILAVDPSGGILLVHVILRRASYSLPFVVDLPGCRYLRQSGFVASYLVVDTTTNTVHPVPHPGILKESARVGILCPSSGFCRYVVAELQLTDGSGDDSLRYFDSHHNKWAMKRERLPIPPGRFNPDCVLSHDEKLWWVDLSYGLLAWDPSTQGPALSFVNLPPRKAFNCSRTQAPDLHRHRCVSVSDGKLRFVDMDGNNIDGRGIRKVSVWTLRADQDSTSTSTEWLLDYEASFDNIWSDRSYKAKRLNKRLPVLAFIHPIDPWTVYFFLDKKLFGINLRGRKPSLVECSDYEPVVPSSNRVSSRFFHALKHEQQQPSCTSSDSTLEGNAGGVNPYYVHGRYTDELFSKVYGARLVSHGSLQEINEYSGLNGQTMDCASQALNHWNETHSTTYELDMTEHMDSNSFNASSSHRFEAEQSYFHVNFCGKSSDGEKRKQFFFAELNGEAGPAHTITVTPLGQDEYEVTDNSAEHICQCCTGLMHPYSTPFLGCEATATHQNQSTSTTRSGQGGQGGGARIRAQDSQ